MVGWLPAAVATLAIRRPYRLVFECCLRPVGGVVTGRTLGLVVLRRPVIRMAKLAVLGINRLVVKIHLVPCVIVVAS